MKKILLAALAALFSIAAFAQTTTEDEYGLFVVTESETATTAVSILRKITFSNGNVVVQKSDGTSETTAMADINRMYFGIMEPVEEHLKGDVNEDGSVDINDVVAIINHMAGTASWRYANVNEDGDGNVDINDVVAVINIMAGNAS